MTRRGSVLLGALVVLGAACSGSSTTVAPPSTTVAPTSTTTTIPWRVPSGPLTQVVLTPDGADRYEATTSGAGSVAVSAPTTNQSTNLRTLIWQTDRPATVDQQQCATWPSVLDLSEIGLAGLAGNPGFWQPGLALRIATNGTVSKAISIAQNVWAGGQWIFWVQMWDTGAEVPLYATIDFDLRELLVVSAAGEPIWLAGPRWLVCARVVGPRLDFKLWTGRSEEPSYTDPTHAFHARLPAEWVYPGYSGSYVGHLRPGVGVRFEDIKSSPAGP